MGPTVALTFSVAFASLCLVVKEIQCCDYEFSNLNSSLSVDWSTSIGSVIYTVQVTKLPENVSATDVLLQIDPPLSEFKFDESNIYQVLVKTCLEHGTTYEAKIKIVNDSNCDTGVLTLTTVFATPHYNMDTTAFTAIPDENPFKPLTEAFIIKISNDLVFGGCGSFTCTSRCNNDVNQDYGVDDVTKILSARWSEITIGFLYNLEVTCFDVYDSSFAYGHSFNADLTFVLTMPTTAITSTTATMKTITPEPTTMTTFKSTASTSKPTLFKAPVSTIRQTSTTSMTSTSLNLDTSKATISAIMSNPTTALLPISDFSAAASYPQTTVDRASEFSTLGSISSVKSSISELTETLTPTTFQQSSNTSSSSNSFDTRSPLGATISGSVLTTLSASQQVYTDFFNKSKNIVTVLLPAVAFSGLAVFGIIYVIYKKVMKKSSITPVIEL